MIPDPRILAAWPFPAWAKAREDPRELLLARLRERAGRPLQGALGGTPGRGP